MKELTIEELNNSKPHSIIRSGIINFPHPYYHPEQYKNKEGAYKTVDEDGMTKVKFVIATGGIGDWAIYISLTPNLEGSDSLDGDSHLSRSYDRVYKSGRKVQSVKQIKRITGCSDEVLKKYRF